MTVWTRNQQMSSGQKKWNRKRVVRAVHQANTNSLLQPDLQSTQQLFLTAMLAAVAADAYQSHLRDDRYFTRNLMDSGGDFVAQ